VDQVTGRKTIQGEVVQVISHSEKDDYSMALGDLVETSSQWSILNFQVPSEPDSKFWKLLIEYTPDWLTEYREVYQVLTKQPEKFEEKSMVEIDVVPSYLQTGKTVKGPGAAPGKAVVYAEDVKTEFPSMLRGESR